MLNPIQPMEDDLLRESAEESEINMAPLIDMIFILLIFFLVTTSFVQDSGVKVERPKAATAEKEEAAGLMIALKEDGNIFIRNRMVPLKNVSAIVDRFQLQNPGQGVLIVADQASQAGRVIQVLDQCRLAGAKDVAVAAEKVQP